MSLKVLKQQIKDITVEEKPLADRVSKHDKKKLLLKTDRFTKSRKALKRNMKPKQLERSIESSIDRIKEDISYAKEKEESNLKWNKKFIETVSTIDGSAIMTKYLQKKGLKPKEEKEPEVKRKLRNVESVRKNRKVKVDDVPSAFAWS